MSSEPAAFREGTYFDLGKWDALQSQIQRPMSGSIPPKVRKRQTQETVSKILGSKEIAQNYRIRGISDVHKGDRISLWTLWTKDERTPLALLNRMFCHATRTIEEILIAHIGAIRWLNTRQLAKTAALIANPLARLCCKFWFVALCKVQGNSSGLESDRPSAIRLQSAVKTTSVNTAKQNKI